VGVLEDSGRGIFGCDWEKVTEGWKKLYNEKFYDLFCILLSIGGQIKEDEMHAVCGRHQRNDKRVKSFVEKSQCKK
jgi:hypothetical protein